MPTFLKENKKTENPENYRPVTCLPTTYELLKFCSTRNTRTRTRKNLQVLRDRRKGWHTTPANEGKSETGI